MSRFALFVIFCLTLLAGCTPSPPGLTPIAGLEYRWGDEAATPYRPIPDFLREPPDRHGATTLHVRFVLPKLDGDDPALFLGADAFDHATVGDRVIAGEPRARAVVPLDPTDGGKSIDLVFQSTSSISIGELFVGSERNVFVYAVGGDLVQFIVGAALVLGGWFLLGAALARRRVLEYTWMGLFTLAFGAMAMGQATAVCNLVYPSPPFWNWLQLLGRVTFPIGLAQFVVRMFGDTRGRVLRLLSFAFATLTVAHLALSFHPYVGRSPVANVTPPLLVFGAAVIFFVVWKKRNEPRARIFLWGFAGLFVINLPDLLWTAGYPIIYFNTTPFGMLVFAGALMLVVERTYRDKATALEKSSEDLTQRVSELESRRKEIESLNDELRHQVETRSRELRAALSEGLPSVQGPAEELRAGDVVGGRYRIVRRIGEGAMGAVYEAERTTDQKKFALKVMTGAITATDAARFAREAEMAAQLRHENLVAIVDVGVQASRSPYLVLELVVGRALDDATNRFGDVPWALGILRGVSSGLAALHHRGIVHRDLKPGNVLLEKGENGAEKAKIGDFGIAREGDDEAPVSIGARTMKAPPKMSARPDVKITQTGALVGTPLYMAPESALGGTVTRAADVFALSLLAYEILTKERPFDPPAVLQTLAGHTIPRVTMPASLRLDLELASAIEHGLAADPSERPTAAELERICSIVVARAR